MSGQEPLQADRSLSDLLAALTTDLSRLFRDEVELAKEEVKQEGRKATRAGAAFGAAAFVGLLAGVALVMTLGFGLDEAMPTWLAFLIVTVLLGAVAAVLAQRGRTEAKAIDPAPQQTIQTLKEDAQWLSERQS
jgi:F0F1-type ATP synthase assembly protein I